MKSDILPYYSQVVNSICEHWKAWGLGKFSFFTLSLQEQGFKGRKCPRASHDCASPVTHLHQSPPLCEHSSVHGPSSYKEKSWTSALDRWLERGCCNQTNGEDLTTPSNSLHPPCAAPAVNLHLICAEAWLKPPLLFWWSLWILLIWTEKFFCFLLFSCIDLAVCVFLQAGSVPSSTTMKHKAPLRVSIKKK